MGVTRKFLSAMSVGLVDWKSDKERIAANTRKQVKATKAQTKVIKKASR